jgi:Domain of unknown function (DUF4126)
MDIFTAFGLSASAGLNAYIPLLIVALMARFTNLITLTSPWDTISNGWVIGLLLILSIVEFFADKIPAVNHINDIIQSFVRPAAGAILFAASSQVVNEINPVLSLVLGILVAGGVHAAKSLAVRPAVTATTAGAGNIPVSMAEDFISTILSIIAVVIPALIVSLIIMLAALIIWLLWRRANRDTYKRV